MPSINQIVSVVAFAGLAITAPTSPKHAFSVPRKAVDYGFLPYGQHQTMKTYQKFNAKAPSHVVTAAAAVTGKVTANPSDQFDSSYLCSVTAGTSVVNLDFDTGSSDLWVFSDKLPASLQTGHRIYKTSATKQLAGYTWSISYGDGSGSSGTVYRDTVTIGGVTYSSQAVEAATSVSAQFQRDTATDGLVGLAFDTINTVKPQSQKTFFSNVAASLASPIVVANLKYHAAGEYDFGFTDPTKYTGAISYTPVDSSQGFWGITVSGYTVGTGAAATTSTSAIADTGTTLVYLPAAIVSAYYAKVAGSSNSATYGGYVFPCSAVLPSLRLKVGTFNSLIPGKYINYAPVTTGSATCYGGVQLNTGLGGLSILGDIWLKAQYVVFDLSGPRLGLATKTLA